VTDALFAGEALDGPTALRLADRGEFRPLPVEEDHHAARGRGGPHGAAAVQRGGETRGSDPALKAETVTIAAHRTAPWARAVDGDAIYNAADDNASGSAALLSIAEQMAKAPRPKRTIVFLWDSGEEQGLWGVRWFVQQPPVPRSSIVAHINVDMIGASRVTTAPDPTTKPVTARNEVYVLGPKVLSAKTEALLASVNDAYLKTRFNHDSDTPESEFFYPRTDAGPFLERGILGRVHDRQPRAVHLPSDEARFLDRCRCTTWRARSSRALGAGDVTERPATTGPCPRAYPAAASRPATP
jgi:hypothetical protein